MGGSALAIADQYDTIGDHARVYQNPEMNELNSLGFAAKPLSYDFRDAANSSRWIGQLPNGDWVVDYSTVKVLHRHAALTSVVNWALKTGKPSMYGIYGNAKTWEVCREHTL